MTDPGQVALDQQEAKMDDALAAPAALPTLPAVTGGAFGRKGKILYTKQLIESPRTKFKIMYGSLYASLYCGLFSREEYFVPWPDGITSLAASYLPERYHVREPLNLLRNGTELPEEQVAKMKPWLAYGQGVVEGFRLIPVSRISMNVSKGIALQAAIGYNNLDAELAAAMVGKDEERKDGHRAFSGYTSLEFTRGVYKPKDLSFPSIYMYVVGTRRYTTPYVQADVMEGILSIYKWLGEDVEVMETMINNLIQIVDEQLGTPDQNQLLLSQQTDLLHDLMNLVVLMRDFPSYISHFVSELASYWGDSPPQLPAVSATPVKALDPNANKYVNTRSGLVDDKLDPHATSVMNLNLLYQVLLRTVPAINNMQATLITPIGLYKLLYFLARLRAFSDLIGMLEWVDSEMRRMEPAYEMFHIEYAGAWNSFMLHPTYKRVAYDFITPRDAYFASSSDELVDLDALTADGSDPSNSPAHAQPNPGRWFQPLDMTSPNPWDHIIIPGHVRRWPIVQILPAFVTSSKTSRYTKSQNAIEHVIAVLKAKFTAGWDALRGVTEGEDETVDKPWSNQMFSEVSEDPAKSLPLITNAGAETLTWVLTKWKFISPKAYNDMKTAIENQTLRQARPVVIESGSKDDKTLDETLLFPIKPEITTGLIEAHHILTSPCKTVNELDAITFKFDGGLFVLPNSQTKYGHDYNQKWIYPLRYQELKLKNVNMISSMPISW